jgi:hypothetical protein
LLGALGVPAAAEADFLLIIFIGIHSFGMWTLPKLLEMW